MTLVLSSTRSSSCMEDRYWEQNLNQLIAKLLKNKQQETIDATVNLLFQQDQQAYDILADALEDNSESCQVEHEGQLYEVLLVSAPILAWTRFSIQQGPLPVTTHQEITAHLSDYFTEGARIFLSPILHSIEQLPQDHCAVYALTRKLAMSAVRQDKATPAKGLPETVPFLADTRYLIAAVAIPAGQALFRWQMANDAATQQQARDASLREWISHTQPLLPPLLPGCHVELMAPDAYYFSCRQADRRIRPASIQAAVHYLVQALNIKAEQLVVSIGHFSQEPGQAQIDEFRLGFVFDNPEEVIYGAVWPLYEQESEPLEETQPFSTTSPLVELSPLGQILQLLADEGIEHIKQHEQTFHAEFCDDCGTPLYPNLEGELVHAQMPEDLTPESSQLH